MGTHTHIHFSPSQLPGCHFSGAQTLTFHNIFHCLLPGTPFTPGWGEENRSKVPFPKTHHRGRDSNTRPHDLESDALFTRHIDTEHNNKVTNTTHTTCKFTESP